jgi:hypothetical protein
MHVAMPVTEEFLRREPVVELDAFEATTVDPEMVGLFLNFLFSGPGNGLKWRPDNHDLWLVGGCGATLATIGPQGSAHVG